MLALVSFLFPDLDECSILNGGCQDKCTNTIGSYVCSCNGNRTLSEDGRSCTGFYFSRNYLGQTCLFIADLLFKSKKDDKDQESIQSSIIPDPGYHIKS